MLYQTKNPHGGDIYAGKILLDYSANTNPLGTPPAVLQAISDALPQLHRYPDPYCRHLVQAISDFEGVPKEYILCGNGAAEIIYAYCRAVKPDLAVETAPAFAEYSAALTGVGCTVRRYYLRQENNFDLDERFLDFLIENKPQAVFLCNPNNPTGRLIPADLLQKILEFCADSGARLFLDECFLDLSDGGVSAKNLLADYPQLFILKAFTKSYGMAGVRLGYCICSDAALLAKMSAQVQPWNVSLLAQCAGVAALSESGFLQKTKQLITAERQWLKQQLEDIGFWVCPSSANYLLLHGRTDLHTELKKHGIAVRNCDNYCGLAPGWYRIAVRTHTENEQLISAVRLICGKE